MSELSLLSKELFYNLMNTAGEQIICGNYALNFCCEQVQFFGGGTPLVPLFFISKVEKWCKIMNIDHHRYDCSFGSSIYLEINISIEVHSSGDDKHFRSQVSYHG